MTEETLSATCRRYVREGEKRVAKQEQIIAKLKRDQRLNLLPLAREVLANLQNGLYLAQKHLAAEMERDEANGHIGRKAHYDAPIMHDPRADLNCGKD